MKRINHKEKIYTWDTVVEFGKYKKHGWTIMQISKWGDNTYLYWLYENNIVKFEDGVLDAVIRMASDELDERYQHLSWADLEF